MRLDTMATFSSQRSMNVQKRNGRMEAVSFDKVLQRIQALSDDLEVNSASVAQKVLGQIYDGVKTSELDVLASDIAINLSTTHPDYGILASRIVISNHQKNTPSSFVEAMNILGNQKMPKTETHVSYISKEIKEVIEAHGKEIDAYIAYDRDFVFDFFGFKTLERAYLLKDTSGKVIERPQHMWMRVALALWGKTDLKKAFATYDAMSQKKFTHATPTLFNAGTPNQQLSSCYLIAMQEDSIRGIYKTLGDCAQISKYAGGIGLHIHNIRAKDSIIRGTNGISNGLVPMLRVYNNTARYCDQGGGRRKGSFAVYLEPWHADIEDFLLLKNKTGAEEERARDLFYALWIPDLFMKRVEAQGTWTLFCPNEAPGLADVYGDEFEALYLRYESEGRGRKTLDAQKLWFSILQSQIENGIPYLLYKDAANKKSNQKNLGTIKSSNLCVAPQTPLWTKNGQVPIGMLENQQVEIWNGDQWSMVTVTKTGTQQPLLKVNVLLTTNNPDLPPSIQTIYCTTYHKFILDSPLSIANAPRVDASTLTAGQKLKSWTDNYNVTYSYTIDSVENDGRVDDTYCFTEPINHAGVFNGVLTGNCTEVIQYSDKDETAVCNLASIGLPAFVKDGIFDFDALRATTSMIVENLNRIIDINFYPTEETRVSNLRNRPIGIGIQGLADVFALCKYSWESTEAQQLNQQIFEHMYYAALETSCKTALLDGPYASFAGSPASQGILQYDMWNIKPTTNLQWDSLKKMIQSHGIRNSLLLAPMPTASTSQILGYNECFEPITSNIYSRRTLAGEFFVINKYLVKDLMELKLWSPEMKNKIILYKGSVQHIPEIPDDIKARYKTSFELKQRILLDMAAARGAFICQSQSMNLFVEDATYSKLSSMHFYGWKKGLKTGCYYLHTRAGVDAQQFTIDPRLQKEVAQQTKQVLSPEQEKKEQRRLLLEKLAREYEEEAAKAKVDAENGVGCMMCSS